MPSCCILTWPVCHACVWREREPSSCEGANSVMRPLLTWLYLSLITSQKPHLQTQLCWGTQAIKPWYNLSPYTTQGSGSGESCFLCWVFFHLHLRNNYGATLGNISMACSLGPPILCRSLYFCLIFFGSTRSHNGFCVIWRAPWPQLPLGLEPCPLLRWCFLWTVVWLPSSLGVPHTLLPSQQAL